MAIDGLSQSTGAERLLEVTAADAGVLLVITDRVGRVERDRLVLPTDELLTALTGGAAGCQTIAGASPEAGEPKLLDVEVRRNEVWLLVRDGADVAVGLDDFQDALEKVIAPA